MMMTYTVFQQLEVGPVDIEVTDLFLNGILNLYGMGDSLDYYLLTTKSDRRPAVLHARPHQAATTT